MSSDNNDNVGGDGIVVPRKKAAKRQTTNGTCRRPTKKAKNNDDDKARKVSQLLHLLPRVALEKLIATCVLGGKEASIDEKDLENLLPENQKWKVVSSKKKKQALSNGQSRVGTGVFDALDDHIVRLIFMALPLRDRFMCVTRVCKSWRAFKNMSGLFNDMTGSLAVTTREQSSFHRLRPHELSGTSAQSVLSILEWHPALDQLTDLRISTRKSCTPNTCKNIMKLVKEAKAPKKKGVAPRPLNKLVLEGPKITAAVLKCLAASPLVASQQLTSLAMEGISNSKLNETSVTDILKQSPNLQHLKLPDDVVNKTSLTYNLNKLSEARNNSPTVLVELDLSEWACSLGIGMEELRAVASSCPELQTLKLRQIRGVPCAHLPPKDSTEDDPVSMPPLFCAVPLQALPRLKTFHLQNSLAFWSKTYTTTACIETLLQWLLAAMPMLEDFFFGVGRPYLSNKERKTYRLPTQWPGVGTALTNLPATIKRLTLQELTIAAADLLERSILVNDSVALESVELLDCGPDAKDALQNLQQRRHNKMYLGVWEKNNDYLCLSRFVSKEYKVHG